MLTRNLKRRVKRIVRPGLSTARYISCIHKDRAQNKRWLNAERRILIVRDCVQAPDAYDVILKWIEVTLPEVRSLFELRRFPCRVKDWSRYALHVPWLPDPVQRWSPRIYSWANRLADKCDEHDIPIINRVERLTNATKALGSRLIASAGIRTPKTERIEDIDEFRETFLGLEFPLIVREDWGHGGPMYRAETPADLYKLPIERLQRPIAVEFIDVRNRDDGLYRKYRYVVVGDEGTTLHMHMTVDWITRGGNCERTESQIEEESDFLQIEPRECRLFQKARKALGLDFIAFDYGFTPEGELIVWEANPFPLLHFPEKEHRMYRRPALERMLVSLVRLYVQKANLPVPSRVDEVLATREGNQLSRNFAADKENP